MKTLSLASFSSPTAHPRHSFSPGPFGRFALSIRRYYRTFELLPTVARSIFNEPATAYRTSFSFHKASSRRQLLASQPHASSAVATPVGTPLGDKLVAMLADPIPARRISAAAILGETGDEYALVPLWPLLSDSHAQVKAAAQSAITRITFRTNPQE